MKDKIKVLIELQDCDNRIQSILKRRKASPLRVKALAEELEAISRGFQEDEEILASLKKDRRGLEGAVEDLENALKKGNDKLSGIKSNKEYTAALKEIDELGKKKTGVEDELIKHMEEFELVSNRVNENKARMDDLNRKFEEDKKVVQAELQELDSELEVLRSEREGITSRADAEILGRYRLIRERLGTSAVSPVVDGVCQSCNMGIPPQMFNELMKCRELASCPHCNRIIYWGDDAQFQNLTNSR